MSGTGDIGSRMVSGWRHKLVSAGMVLYVLREAVTRYGTQSRTFSVIRSLYKNFRRHGYALGRIVHHCSLYYVNLSVQGWPSPAYDRYLHHLMDHVDGSGKVSLHSAIFSITNACAFHCEHCVEWDNLNKTDKLSSQDISLIIGKLHEAGTAQVLFSGGEPLSRYQDLLEVIGKAPKDMEYWIFTNGWKLDDVKANELREKGLTGVLVSLDHYTAEGHDKFRGMPGAFDKAIEAIAAAKKASLLTGITLVATNEFITEQNLLQYLEMARRLEVDFVQFLEPEAEGRYRDMPVQLQREKQALLEDIHLLVNTENAYDNYPLITYYPYMKRTAGCAGRGQHFLYIDADGDVHPCPFCRNRKFSMLSGDINANIEAMRSLPCTYGSRLGFLDPAPDKKTNRIAIRT